MTLILQKVHSTRVKIDSVNLFIEKQVYSHQNPIPDGTSNKPNLLERANRIILKFSLQYSSVKMKSYKRAVAFYYAISANSRELPDTICVF